MRGNGVGLRGRAVCFGDACRQEGNAVMGEGDSEDEVGPWGHVEGPLPRLYGVPVGGTPVGGYAGHGPM